MPIQSDYVMRAIEQLSAVVRAAIQKAARRDPDEHLETAAEAISLVLDIDPALASQLSPRSLAAMLDLGRVDERVVELLAEAIEIEADDLESRGQATAADFRREQARAVRGAQAGCASTSTNG